MGRRMHISVDAATLAQERIGLGSGKYLVIGVDVYPYPYEVFTETVLLPGEPLTLEKLRSIGGLYFVIVKSVTRKEDRPTPEESQFVEDLNRSILGEGMSLLDFVNIAESGWFSWADAGLLAPHGGM